MRLLLKRDNFATEMESIKKNQGFVLNYCVKIVHICLEDE